MGKIKIVVRFLEMLLAKSYKNPLMNLKSYSKNKKRYWTSILLHAEWLCNVQIRVPKEKKEGLVSKETKENRYDHINMFRDLNLKTKMSICDL